MRTYRATWATTVVLAVVVAALVGGAQVGWGSMVAATALPAAMGASLGMAWAETEHRWRLVGLGALWGGAGGVLLVGLPLALGAWSLLALLLLGGGAPVVLQRGLDLYRERHPVRSTDHPERLDDRDLERRWRRTSEELRHPSTSPADALRLVEERALLLDEIERRDPVEFAAVLVRAGWRSADAADL